VQILVEDILKNKGWSFIINDLSGERYALISPWLPFLQATNMNLAIKKGLSRLIEIAPQN
jgi:hypothetical protein